MKNKRAVQKEFLSRCASSVQPLEDLLEDLGIEPKTFLNWTSEREFQSKLHGMRRFLKRARDLQLEASSLRAARTLCDLTTPAKGESANHVTRAACVDVIRLARDSRARRRSQDADEINRQRRLLHPDVSDEDATRLMTELEASRQELLAEHSDPSR